MGINYVEFNKKVLVDLREDTAEAGDVMRGAMFHNKNGNLTIGTYDPKLGLIVTDVVDTVEDLPSAANRGDLYLVGTSSPYTGYIWLNNEWVDAGEMTPGPKGEDGRRGNGILFVTTEPDVYSEQIGDLHPSYRILTSDVVVESGASDVYVGDVLECTTFHYPVIYVDEYLGYVYCGNRTNIKGAVGETPSVVSSTVEYQVSSYGDTIPTGTWTETVPQIIGGQYLWVRTTIEFSTGNPVVTYSVAYQGKNGSGQPGNSIPKSDVKDGDIGTSNGWARQDHRHPLNVGNSYPKMDGEASAGTSEKYSRADHVHPADTHIVGVNLLDNWYFVSGDGDQGVFPINQRGKVQYRGGESVNRWVAEPMDESDIITVRTSGLTYESPNKNILKQYVEYMPDDDLTFSMFSYYDTRRLFSLTLNKGEDEASMEFQGLYGTFAMYISRTDGFVGIQPLSGYAHIGAVKLETGRVQTLVSKDSDDRYKLRTTPNYSEEYAKTVNKSLSFENVNLSVPQQTKFRENIGAGTGWKLMWENPDPTVAFESVSISGSGWVDYNMLLFVFYASDSSKSISQSELLSVTVPNIYLKSFIAQYIEGTTRNSINCYAYGRRVIIYNNVVQFLSGRIKKLDQSTAAVDDDSVIIPFRVYGAVM